MNTPSGSLLIEHYRPQIKAEWDAFAGASKNGTFLFERDYMDYHSDRFVDHSLIVREGQKIVALLPANRVGDELHSHQGLTYGGFVTSDTMTTPRMMALLAAAILYLQQNGFRRLHYKTIPSIYHRLPAEEDRYALFLVDAALSRRDVLSVVPRARLAPVQTRRRRGASKAMKHGITVERTDDFERFWKMLDEHLQARFGVRPVHSLAEIQLLTSRFPQNITLFTAALSDEVLAGVVIFESPEVAHAQYIAASERGYATGALDAVFLHLLDDVYVGKSFFDFGISNEQAGRHLNTGLIEQKEGFGGRAIAHDFYTLQLD